MIRSEFESSLVSTTIGQSTDTPMPLSLTSRARFSASPTTPFRDAVGAEADVGHQAGERRGEGDVAAGALLEQPGQERLDGMDRAPQVNVDHPAPVVVRHLRDRTRDHNAGVAE